MDLSSPPFQALLLGILQGLTEFLPISSSAHLILLPWFFQWNNPLLDSLPFDVALHAGTLLAILGYFWRDWLGLIGGFSRILRRGRVQDVQERLIIYIILATLPAGIVGVLLEKTIESTFRNPALITLPLIFVSFLMVYAERRNRLSRSLEDMSLKDAMAIGCAQAVALLPGVSRSGITITTGLFQGYRREAATRFSFLLSTPAIAGATIMHARHLFSARGDDWSLIVIGFVSSTVVGYAAIAFLLRYLRVHTLNLFAGYRLILAALVICWIFWKG
jgi:undecaprenyl-diphosphatase